MDCKQIDQLLVDYLYQELDATQKASFEEHLRGCSQCAEDLRSFEDTRAVMRDLDTHDPPPAITRLILEEAAKAAPSLPTLGEKIRGFFRLMVMHPALAAAATLVAVLGVSFYVYREGLPPVSEGPRNDLPLVSAQAAKATISAAPAAGKREDERAFKPKLQGQQAADPVGGLRANRPAAAAPLRTSGPTRATTWAGKRGFVDRERDRRAETKKVMIPPVQAPLDDLKDSNTDSAKGYGRPATVAKSRPRKAPVRRRLARRARRVANTADYGGGGSGVWGNKYRSARRPPAPARAPKPSTPRPVAKTSIKVASSAEGRTKKNDDADRIAMRQAAPQGGRGQTIHSERPRRGVRQKKTNPAAGYLLAGNAAVRAGKCSVAFDRYTRAISLKSTLRSAVYQRLGRCRSLLSKSKRHRQLAALMIIEGRRYIASRKAAARRRAAKRAYKKAKAKPAAADAYQAK